MKTNFYIGQRVKISPNPNPVDIIYRIADLNVYVDGCNVKAIADLAVTQDYDLPSGGRIYAGQERQEDVMFLVPQTD